MRKLPLPILLPTALLALALLALTSVAGATELEGRVVLAKGAKEAKGVEQTLITFTPARRVPLEIPAEPFEMVTAGKKFEPRTLVVPVGATVRFPNQDNILHNVFSVSGENRFDLGLYRRGEGKEVDFGHPGVVRVFCNVHHSMVAYVAVVETPFTTTAGADGRFRLSGLPAGAGTLTMWHERSDPWKGDVVVPSGEAVEVRLEVTKPQVPHHTNKLGLPYARKRSGHGYR